MKTANKKTVSNLSQNKVKSTNHNGTLIPSGWSKTSLGKEVDFYNGKAHEDCVTEQGKYTLINSRFVSTGGNSMKYCSSQRFPLYRGDIAMVMSDVPNGKALARCFLIKKNNQYTLNQRICCFRSKNALPIYLQYILNRNKYYLVFDNGVGQTNLRKDEILECPLILPPLAEQKAIVAVLETWDRAIEKTGQLIQAKEKQFKWLLKKLITDQQQNPTWQKVKLGDIFKLGRGRVISKKEIENNPGKFPVYSSQTFNNGELGRINTYDFEGDYVTWTTDGANAGAVFYRTGKFNCTNVCGTAKPIEPKKISCQFISYSLIGRTKKYVSYVGNHKLMNDVFSEILFFLPISKVEQNKIARILYIAQQEIDLLKKTVEKYQIQKKGLMQKLLTGQWRLKV